MNKAFDVNVAAKICAIWLFLLFMVGVQTISAREIAGVAVPESVSIKNKALVLNGAGIRKKLFIKIYVGGLYLPAKSTSVSEILADPGAKRIFMSFLYKEVSAERLVEGWNEGFAGNNTEEEQKVLQDRIKQFNALFTPVHKGDEIRLDFIPGEGTQVWINETFKGTVPGEDFFRALLKIWLGDKPADADLKNAMLGK
jgi:hypothetical protein